MKYDEPLLVVGFHRAGTSILTHMLTAHRETMVFNEVALLLPGTLATAKKRLEIIKQWKDGRVNWGRVPDGEKIHKDLCSLDVTNVKNYVEMADRVFGKIAKWRKIYGDKCPNFVAYFEQLSELCPKAKYIFPVRDPRDLWVAGTRQSGVWPTMALPSMKDYIESENKISFSHGGLNLAWRWQEWCKWKQKFNYIEYSYEELAYRPAKVLRLISDFLEIDYKELKRVYSELFKPRHIGSYKAVWKDAFSGMLSEECKRLYEDFGYII